MHSPLLPCMWKAMIHKFLTAFQICLLLVAALQVVVAEPNPDSVARPGCKESCGSVLIPFPFGIGEGCFLDPWFEIECRPSSASNSKDSSPTPYLSKLNSELVEASALSNQILDQGMRVRLPLLKVCNADTQSQQQSSINLTGSPFYFSGQDNYFMMKGCPGSAVLVDQSNSIMAGCATVCGSNSTVHSCNGVLCCQTEVLDREDFLFQFYQIGFSSQPSDGRQQNCLEGTLLDWDATVNQDVEQYLSSSELLSGLPVLLRWGLTSDLVPGNISHATCSQSGPDGSFSCMCDINCDGNPYIGCTAPEGCEGCRGYCLNQLDAAGTEISKYYCKNKPLINHAAILGLANSFGILILLACLYGLYRFIKRRVEMKRRVKFFKRNGGLLLQQQLSSNEGVVERTKIFTISELNKATNNFNENRILGQGGQGTVYKGMLIDGRIVGVKKSKLVDESQLEQFINEVVVLSQVNHRHVVKLFGCCLETEVPLLVYEFIPNGTLYQHIHHPDEDFFISWEMRLKIAADSAGAIAYLHSSSSIPIYHRDIKSSNILLDEKHRAKVSDFGSSKTIAVDQTHLTTLVQGTMGYLDPEYFQSYQFTEKSDVYSFGVVLLELLTSKKPIIRGASTLEQKNLVTEFQFLTQNSRLSEILDPEIVKHAKEDELISVVELAKRCVSWSGRVRPTMKEVAMTLERIMKSPAQVSAWYQQQEEIPIQYAAYDEFDMTDISREEFTSVTLPAGASSPPYTDENPLLPYSN